MGSESSFKVGTCKVFHIYKKRILYQYFYSFQSFAGIKVKEN